MTLQQFFKHLEKAGRSKTIKTFLEGPTSYGGSKKIRLRNSSGDKECPITFVCRKITGKRYKLWHASEAAQAIELRADTIITLMDVADGDYDYARTTEKRHRRRMLRVLNLKEPADHKAKNEDCRSSHIPGSNIAG